MSYRPGHQVFGAQHVGATSFSVYNALAADQLTHVLANAGAKVVFCEEQYGSDGAGVALVWTRVGLVHAGRDADSGEKRDGCSGPDCGV